MRYLMYSSNQSKDRSLARTKNTPRGNHSAINRCLVSAELNLAPSGGLNLLGSMLGREKDRGNQILGLKLCLINFWARKCF